VLSSITIFKKAHPRRVCHWMLVGLVVVFASGCGGGGGGGGGGSGETTATPSTANGKLAQGYVKDAQIWLDKTENGSQLGNLQRDPGEPDTISGSDGSYTLSNVSGSGVLITSGGTYLNSKGEGVAAAPMLAPMPEAGQVETNITPLTTLVVAEPDLKAVLDVLGGWNSDIAAPAGTAAALLRIAKTVEGLSGILGQGDEPIALNETSQLQSLVIFASQLKNLDSSDLASETVLQQASSQALSQILDDTSLVRTLSETVKDQVQSSMGALVTSITDTIPASGLVVESEVVSKIEVAQAEAETAIQNELDQQVIINLGGLGFEFEPIIKKITLQLNGTTLQITGEASDERPDSLVYSWTTSPSVQLTDATIANPSLPNFDGSTVTFVLQVKDDTDLYVTEVCTWDNSSNPITCDFVGD